MKNLLFVLGTLIFSFGAFAADQANCKIFLHPSAHLRGVAQILREKGYEPTTQQEGAKYGMVAQTNDIVKASGSICQDLVGVRYNVDIIDLDTGIGEFSFTGQSRKHFYQPCQGNQYDLRKVYFRAFNEVLKGLKKDLPGCI